MKTKLAYVLTTDGKDYLFEITLMSVFSAYHHNPGVQIILIVDNDTNLLLQSTRGSLLRHYISETIVITFPSEDNYHFRSRYLKTKLRSLLSGPVLYIDNDTIVTRRLDDIDKISDDVTAVLDWMQPVAVWPENIKKEIGNRTDVLGVNLLGESLFFNGGVIRYEDTTAAHQFSDLWNSLYLQFRGVMKLDQPSLCKANILCEHIIKELHPSFNCQMNAHPPRPQDAAVLHFAANSRNYSWLYSKHILERIKNLGIQDEIIIYGLLHPLDTCLITAAQCREMSFRSYCRNIKKYTGLFRKFANSIDSNFEWLQARTIQLRIVKFLLRHKAYYAASQAAILPRWLYAKLQING